MLGVSSTLGGICALAAVAIAVLASRWRSLALRCRGLREPPGPRPHFLLGNVSDIPAQDFHLAYARMAEQYGPIMKLSTPTSTIVVLSSKKVIEDILDKRGAITSDRPKMHMALLAGWEWNFGVMGHGPEWRSRRRVMHQYIGRHTTSVHEANQTAIAHALARNLLDTPDDFIAHVKRSAAASILRTTYGIDIEPNNDSFVKLAEDGMAAWGTVITPGAWAVDWLPSLKYLPTWLPGAGFKRYALEVRKHADAMANVPFDHVRKEMDNGNARTCMVAEQLSQGTGEVHSVTVRDAAGVMYLGGVDTTSVVLQSFFMAMTTNPDAQKTAQEEIDRVIGVDRLPTFADRESLPYLTALVLEIYRFFPVVPIGLPHTLEQDEVYEGMYLQRGTIFIANIWGLMHDRNTYSDPHSFKPERFLRDGNLDESVPSPFNHIFGYGRRICPGRYFADASVFISIATVLACFNIGKKVVNGEEITPSCEFRSVSISLPLPFQCAISPRSRKAALLITQSLEATA